MVSTRSAAARKSPPGEGPAAVEPVPAAASSSLYGSKQLPSWYISYTHINSGYRSPQTTLDTGVLKSLFFRHNELLNIWLHIGGFLLHAALNLYWGWGPGGWASKVDSDDVTIIAVSIACSGSVMLLCSAAAHLLANIQNVQSWIWRMDFGGIATAIYGGSLGVTAVQLKCMPELRLWWTVLCSALFLTVFVCTVFLDLGTVTNMILYIVMSVLLWSPPIVLFLTSGLFGSEQLNAIMQDDRMFQCGVCAFLAALCVIMGTVFYASRWPEKYRPMDFQGKYLNLGSSHQIWHVWLVISVIFVSLMYTGLADRLASFDKGSCHLNRTALAL